MFMTAGVRGDPPYVFASQPGSYGVESKPASLPHPPKRQIHPLRPQRRMLAVLQGRDAMKSQP